ncbi:hypothetical protein SBA2_520015 [Acidobacteriia bacterium SbA2]|nr:hypothetical protein SBA2_520015 [Acidobacteriia bacterium SbA2]
MWHATFRDDLVITTIVIFCFPYPSTLGYTGIGDSVRGQAGSFLSEAHADPEQVSEKPFGSSKLSSFGA